ncbi:MAG: IPT/TIG domain-containing protein [Candidatus Hydrogenedentes bacterium]|nr:IPT/TIG domain-containing protein [Candidatus Hydrogenedentota bacterium]
MGNRKKLVLASLVGVMMMLSFAIGLVPSQLSGPPLTAKAAQGATEVAISADGVTPVGDNFSIPVGGEQSFTALSVTNGAGTHLISTGDASWSLATDGAAALSAVAGDFVATVSALAPGEAGLYVSTGDGLSDLVNLTLYNLKSAKNGYGTLDSVTITQPTNNTTLHVPSGATAVPLTLTSATNNPANTAKVEYSDSTSANYGFSTTPPYAVTIPDVKALGATATITAVASSIAKYGNTVSDSVTISIQADAADGNDDGLPDNPFGLGLGEGEHWVSVIDAGGGHYRYVYVVGMGVGAKAIDIPTGGVSVSIADPANPARVVTVTAPPNLLAAGQSGLLVVEAADDITTLLGATQAANVNAEPAGGLVTGGQYVEIGVLVSSDGGTTFGEIDNAALTSNPLTLEIQGLSVLAGDNVRLFDYPTTITNGNPIGVTADSSGAWAQISGGTQVVDGTMTAELTSLSMFAPYSTPTAIHLFGVNNTSGDPNVTGAQAYSVNGGSVDVTVDNLPAGSVTITIDGVTATQTNRVGNVITITAPNAAALATPASSNAVDIRIVEDADATNFDVSPKGFTYVGPILTSVSPPSGSHNGGDAITITGSGFGGTATADIGGAAVTSPSVVNATTITGVTGSHTPGNFTLTVTLSNNYQGTANGLYSYLPDAPTLTSVFPDAVYTDGGYTVKATGTNFVDPNALLKAAAQTYGLFTAAKGVQDPSVDRPAVEVQFLDDTHMNLVTPQVTAAGLYDMYMATGLDVAAKALYSSGMVDFTFVDPASATMHITSIDPNIGPLAGGNSVAISGDHFPVAAGGDITSGNVLRVANAFGANGTIVNINLSLFRGTDAVGAPAAINGKVTFSTSVLTPRNGGVADPPFVADALLGTWYAKTASVSAATAGEVSYVFSGGTTEITTFDNQRFGGTVTDQQNPFPLGFFRFDVVGATNDTTIVQPTNITMADHSAVALTDVSGQGGFFNVGTSAATPPTANVYFGDKTAALDTTKRAQTSTLLYVFAPAGDAAGGVDVRVVNPADATDFAISRASQLYASGGGYTYNPAPPALTVDSITPNEAWAFGGTVAHISGTKFEYGAKAVSQVFFGSVAAEIAPAPYVNTSTDLYVIVPPLANPSATLASPTQQVDITVTNSDSESVVKPNFFTYNLYTRSTETYDDTGDVYTTGFAFTQTTGTGATGQKVSLSDDAATAGAFVVPAGITAAKPTSTGQIFGLVRATKVPGVFGVQDLPGTAIGNIWNFDIHLYSGDYPFDEINVSFNTDETPITLRYPTDDATLTLAVNSATLSTYSHDSTFDYNTSSLSVSAPALYQSNVLPSEEVVTAGNITEVTTRLYHLSALALRKDAEPPVISCDLEGADREANEGDTIDLTGQGLGWVTGIEVLTDSDVGTKSVTDVLAGSISADEYHISFRFPAVQAAADGPAQLRVLVNDGTAGGRTLIVNGLTVRATTRPPTGLLQLLLGLLVALFGLAGGGDHGGGGGGPCFIATAAYGTPMAQQIDTLRDFRDAYLLNNAVGSAFVDAYYHVSPAVADVVAKSPVMAAVVRILLVPVILLAKMAVAMPHLTIALSLLTGLAMFLRRLKKAKKA